MKILVLCAYYDRPNMVRNALNSLVRQDFADWELAFVDDTSAVPGEPVVREILSEHLHKVRFFNTHDPDKKARGSIFGKFWNEALLASDADISLILCDDDALYPGYLKGLSAWFEKHPREKYSFGHVVPFDPFQVRSLESVPRNTKYWLNRRWRVKPYQRLDASQVAWRNEAFRDHGVRFPFPKTKDLDSALYVQLYKLYGRCPFNGMIAQYKAIFPDQLGNRPKSDLYTVRDIDFRPT